MLVEQQLIINWNLQRQVEKLNFRFLWNIEQLLEGASLSINWGILGALTKSFTFNWDLERVLIPIRQCRVYEFPCANRISDCAVSSCVSPDAQKRISKRLNIEWEITPLVTAPLNIVWDIFLPVLNIIKPVTFKWEITNSLVCGLPLSRFTTSSKQRQMGQHTFCMNWSDDGNHFYTGQAIHRTVKNFTVSNSWEVDTFTLVGDFNPDLDVESMQDTDGIFVKPDGTELWIHGHTGLGSGYIVQYALGVPYRWDNNVPTKIGSKNTGQAQFKHIYDLSIKPDGTEIMSYGRDTNHNPYQLNMSAWDVTTLSYAPYNQIIDASECFVPAGGECMYVAAGQTIRKYLFGTPWDLSTLNPTIVESLNLSAIMTANITCIFITSSRLFVVDDNDVLFQFNSA